MPSLLPEIQVGPLGGTLLYVLIGLALLGFYFSATLGGAIVWILMWVAILVVAYFLIVRGLRFIFGGRGI